ncbi:zinc finger and BTB domain-containing protein 1 [Phycodurus eques]|uniref:zinc finger and BTB domain-containing protein 1 n=1 Tax=Phycodurus eques TaxID=693459 RepID=UPI002ACE38B2|nr:zinc finger and BTB domain-containing protein 1 [Phycodurus eques]XP_061559855.1 zinc finger and BTB domain-containing protein 1 [Phycodurus eques]
MARPSHSDHVLQQLNNQREWGFLCDCLIAIGDIYFRAHKAVLAACSSYFRMMFIREQQGAARLDLSDMQISAECFDLILQLMYLGRIAAGTFDFDDLKASMVYLQMYYIPDSLEDLRDIRSGSNLTPSSSECSTAAASSGGKMLFGVRMYERKRTAGAQEPANGVKTVSSSARYLGGPPVIEEASGGSVHGAALPSVDAGHTAEQPCDLRKRSAGRSSTLRERPRFGRTFTCDDCGFVFSCEKLLIEHILTCTNRKTYAPACSLDGDNDSAKAESSASDSAEDHRMLADLGSVAAGPSDGAGSACVKTIKTEPGESPHPEDREAGGGNGARVDWGPGDENCEAAPGVSGVERAGERCESAMSGSDASATSPVFFKVKDEESTEGAPCELCGALLSEDDKSAHYLSSHLGHICACGRCGQVLIKGRQLQQHAEHCGESDEADEPHGADDGLLEGADLACPHCGLPFESESLALEHALSCPHEADPIKPGGPDHRRKHFCAICGKGFYQRCHLREHYTVHTKEKQFTCQTCGKRFLRERQLRLHTDMHRGVARYVCPVCDQGTFLKHDHVRHMISHLAVGETICQVCFQIFPGGEQLEEHMDVHLYVCGVCGDKFRLRKDMRTHYNLKHAKRL